MRRQLSKLPTSAFGMKFWAKLQSPCLHLQTVRNMKEAKDFAGSRCTIGRPVFTHCLILATFWLLVWLASAVAAVSSCESEVFCRVIYGNWAWCTSNDLWITIREPSPNGALYILNGPPAHWCQISMEIGQTISSIFFMFSPQNLFLFSVRIMAIGFL